MGRVGVRLTKLRPPGKLRDGGTLVHIKIFLAAFVRRGRDTVTGKPHEVVDVYSINLDSIIPRAHCKGR